MSKFRTNQTVLVKFEAIPKTLREQHRWYELSNFGDIYSKHNPIYHLYGIIAYESKLKPRTYYVDIPESGLDLPIWINEEYLSPFDLNKEPERVDTKGDKTKMEMGAYIPNNLLIPEFVRFNDEDLLFRLGEKFYSQSYENLKGDKTKMGAYIPDNLLPKQIIYSDPATIVFWGDGTKTIVKVSDKENFNPYYGFCAALAKKVYGNNSLVNKIVSGGVYDTSKDKKKKKKPQKDISGKDSGTIPKPKTANEMDSYLNTIVNPFDIFGKDFDRIIARALDIRKEDEDND